MDVIYSIYKDMEGRHLSDIEKMRYIYLRVCELFHFSSKWWTTDETGDLKLEKEIMNRKIDLENVRDFSVICHTVSREVLQPLIQMLTSLETRIVGTETHTYLEVQDGHNNRWELDASCNDMSRVKLGIIPTGMKYLRRKGIRQEDLDIDFGKEDFTLGYKFVPRDTYVKLFGDIIPKDLAIKVSDLLSTKPVRYHYTDATYLLELFELLNKQKNSIIVDKELKFHRLYTLDNDSGLFELHKKNGVYVFEEINQERYDEVTNKLVYR